MQEIRNIQAMYDHLSDFHLYSNTVSKYTNTVLSQYTLGIPPLKD